LELNKESIGKALGRIASGVYIVTVGQAENREGMLATWISQVAFEPPILSVVVKRDRPILLRMAIGAPIVVNVLGKKNLDIFKNFAKPQTVGAEPLDRFAGLNVIANAAGPVLGDSVAFLTGSVLSTVESGDHVIVLVQVEGGSMLQPDEPMVHLRSNGFQY
jgi:flavin reductase (DIM6/NTAB) family NADH-FMN oxidoreductase RutF